MSNKFRQLIRFRFSKGRFLVISLTNDGRVSMGQQIELPDEPGKFIFAKNAIVFGSIDLFKDFIKQLIRLNVDKERGGNDGK